MNLTQQTPTDENKINSQYQKLISHNMKSASASSAPVKENPRNIRKGYTSTGPMKSELMTWTQMLESMDAISDSIDAQSDDPINAPAELPEQNVSGDGDESDLIDQLNKLFTPVLIMQGFENDSSDKIQEQMSEASTEFIEKSIIQFDDDTRMSQLIAVCAKLIARKKNTEEWQMYAKAYEIKKKMDLEIQKKEYDTAKNLAMKYLVNVSTTNNSPVARNAASALLPATQH